MGRFIFLSAVAYLAYRYIGRSNQKHQEIASKVDGTEVLPPAAKPSAALVAAPETPKLLTQRSAAAEPDPRR